MEIEKKGISLVCDEKEYSYLLSQAIERGLDWETVQLSDEDQKKYETGFTLWLEGEGEDHEREMYVLLKR